MGPVDFIFPFHVVISMMPPTRTRARAGAAARVPR